MSEIATGGSLTLYNWALEAALCRILASRAEMRFTVAMKSVVRIAIAASLLAVLPAAANAQQQQSQGLGNVTCGQFIKAARSSDILYHQASSWMLGYASGRNEALKGSGVAAPAASMSNDQLLKLAGDYCEKNPSSTILAAANQWYVGVPAPAAAAQAAPAGERGWYLDLNKSSGYRGPKP